MLWHIIRVIAILSSKVRAPVAASACRAPVMRLQPAQPYTRLAATSKPMKARLSKGVAVMSLPLIFTMFHSPLIASRDAVFFTEAHDAIRVIAAINNIFAFIFCKDNHFSFKNVTFANRITVTTMQETRQNKIARLLQKELSIIFQRQTQQMHGVMVSVTRTKVSPDLSICTAYLSIFPSEKAEEIIKNVTANEKSIRYELGTKVRYQLRIIPELRFFVDDSLDYIERIDALLKE